MKALYIVFGLAGPLLWGCAAPMLGSDGNPSNQPYVGSPESVWDAAQNPPATIGVAAYNPDIETAPPPSERVQGESGDAVSVPNMPNGSAMRPRHEP